MLRIAGHTLGTPGMDVLEALELFAAAGLDAAELIWQQGYEAGLPERDGGRVVGAVERRARELGLGVCALTPYMSAINSLDDAERERDVERFRRCLADAARLGAPIVRVYAGAYQPGEPDRSAKHARLVESLRLLARDAQAAGVTLAVENHFNTMAVSARETVELVEAVAEPAVGILYDQANLAFTHGEDAEAAIALQAPWIRHVHVKDLVFVDRDRPLVATAVHKVDAEERAVRSRVVGDGELDWPGIVAALLNSGYDGALSLEYEYRWHPQDLPEPAEGLRRGAETLREYLGAARS